MLGALGRVGATVLKKLLKKKAKKKKTIKKDAPKWLDPAIMTAGGATGGIALDRAATNYDENKKKKKKAQYPPPKKKKKIVKYPPPKKKKKIVKYPPPKKTTKKQSLYSSKDKLKHFKKEAKDGVPFDIPVSPSDMPKWFQKATKGILADKKKKKKN